MSGRMLQARAYGFAFDRVLQVLAAAAALLPLTFLMGLPEELRDAPIAVRAEFASEARTVAMVYAAALAAVYGSFRYTVDHRDGVIARQVTLARRTPVIASRVPFVILGGVLIAAVVAASCHGVLWIALGGVPLPAGDDAGGAEVLGSVPRTMGIGALAAVWGFSLGVVVRRHILALFVVPFSLTAALPLAGYAPVLAGWLPLPALARALGFDLSSFGLAGASASASVLALVESAAWIGAALCVALLLFARRDVK